MGQTFIDETPRCPDGSDTCHQLSDYVTPHGWARRQILQRIVESMQSCLCDDSIRYPFEYAEPFESVENSRLQDWQSRGKTDEVFQKKRTVAHVSPIVMQPSSNYMTSSLRTLTFIQHIRPSWIFNANMEAAVGSKKCCTWSRFGVIDRYIFSILNK